MRISRLGVDRPKSLVQATGFILPEVLGEDDGLSSEHVVCEIHKVGHPIDIGKYIS